MIRRILRIVVIIIPFISYSQITETFTYGLKVGALQSSISNIPEMISGRDNSFSNYSLKSDKIFGAEGGFFLNYKLPNTRVAIQTELLYRKAGDKVSYSNDLGKNYLLTFNYSYITFGALYKIYPIAGLNIGAGAFYSKNISSGEIEYESNEFDGRYDVINRQFYRDALKGSDDFSLAFNLGYEIEPGFHIDFRYYLGVSDAITNKGSDFKFIENKNTTSTFGIALGYSIHQW